MPREQKAILERLEATKQYGLVADYLVSFNGSRGKASPKVTIWSNHGTPEAVVQDYIVRLLRGLVTDRQIVISSH